MEESSSTKGTPFEGSPKGAAKGGAIIAALWGSQIEWKQLDLLKFLEGGDSLSGSDSFGFGSKRQWR